MLMNTLTKAEEQVMQILWDEKEGFVKDLLKSFLNPSLHTIQYPPLSEFWKRKDLWITGALENLTSTIPW